MTPRRPANVPDDRVDPLDRRLSRFLEWDSDDIDGAPSQGEMIERMEAHTRGRGAGYRWLRLGEPAGRLLIVLGLVAALLGAALAAGTWWSERGLLFRADLPILLAGPVRPGRYRVTENTNLPYAITLPNGWTLDADGFIGKGDYASGTGVAVTTWLVTHVYRDACSWTDPPLPVSSANPLVPTLAAQDGHATGLPTSVRFGANTATRVDVSVPAGFDSASCVRGQVHLWPDPGPDSNGGLSARPGQTISVYVLEHATLTVLLTVVRDGASPTDLAELAGLVESVRFAQQ